MQRSRIQLALTAGVLGLAAALAAPASGAAEFAVRISPPNFQLAATPGAVLREVVEIQNSDAETAVLTVRTGDWDLDAGGGVRIVPAEAPLPPDSCRSWTRIERHRMSLAPGQTKRYRFEVHVPADAARGECRFALLIAPAPETVTPTPIGDRLRLPVLGQLAVIVYVAVGDARPVLAVEGIALQQDASGPTARIALRNTGDAHGRPFGSLSARDAGGRTVELVVVPFPVLPGRTGTVVARPDPVTEGDPRSLSLSPPVSLVGRIEWTGGEVRIDERVERITSGSR